MGMTLVGKALWEVKNLTPPERLVLIYLCDAANEQDGNMVSGVKQDAMAHRFGLTREWVCKTIRSLKDKGLVKSGRTKGNKVRYWVLLKGPEMFTQNTQNDVNSSSHHDVNSSSSHQPLSPPSLPPYLPPPTPPSICTPPPTHPNPVAVCSPSENIGRRSGGLFFSGSPKAEVPVNGTAGPGGHQKNSTITLAKGGQSPSDPPLRRRRPPPTSAQKAKWAEAVARDVIIDLYPTGGFVPTTLDRKKIRGAIMNCQRRGLTLEQITRQVERLAKMVETGDYRKHRVPKDPFFFFYDPEVVADQKRWGQKFFPLVQDWEFQLESWGWLSDQFTLPSADSQPAHPATQEGGVCRVIPPKSS